MSKTDHLAKAKDYIAKGEDYYRKAAEEIVAAQTEDSTLSNAEVGRCLGRNESWVRRLVTAHHNLGGAGEFTPFARDEKDAHEIRQRRDAEKVLRDPARRREVIESLEPEERVELVREVSRSTSALASDSDRAEEREVFRSIEDAPNRDLSALAARLVATAARIEVELGEGAEYRRMGAKDLQRLDRDLDRVKDTADRLKEQIAAQSRVRRIA